MIEVLYFASLRERLGASSESIEPTPANVEALLARLSARGEDWAEVLQGRVLVAVNQEMAKPDTALKDGDEVGLFPPVTGG